MKTGNAIVSFFVLAGLIFFAGCKSQKASLTDPLAYPESFSESGTVAVPDRWWLAFDDVRLNALIDTALSSNFSLQAAWQRMEAARALLQRQKSYRYPELNAFFDAGFDRQLESAQNNESYAAGLSAYYELDLWGRIRSSIDAEAFRTASVYADYQAASLSLAAEIALTWFRLIEARNQIELIDQQILTNEKALTIIRNRFGSGLIRSVDILRQEQLLEATREQKVFASLEVGQLENRLNVLLGNPPQDSISYTAHQLPDLPLLPATGIPVELVQRRPDVQSAWMMLRSADREMAAAVSNKYPRLTINATLTSAVDNVSNLFEEWTLSLAGGLLAPVFYGKRLQAEVDRAEAVKYQRLYEYGQAVLVSFREVEDALILEKMQQRSIISKRKQLENAEQTAEQLRIEYLNGMSDYLDVLLALDDEQRLRRELLSSRRILLEYRIALYRALAGGFETPFDNDSTIDQP